MGRKTNRGFSPRGGVVIECGLVLLPISLFFLLNLELFRRSVLEVVLFKLSCIEVRDAVLGTPQSVTKDRIRTRLISAFGKELGEKIFRSSRAELFRVENRVDLKRLDLGKKYGGVAERYYRYAQFISFEFQNQRKHHQEIIKRCLFPF